jgi:hypothetical protein
MTGFPWSSGDVLNADAMDAARKHSIRNVIEGDGT